MTVIAPGSIALTDDAAIDDGRVCFRASQPPVPELTCSAGVKLNKQVSLRSYLPGGMLFSNPPIGSVSWRIKCMRRLSRL